MGSVSVHFTPLTYSEMSLEHKVEETELCAGF